MEWETYDVIMSLLAVNTNDHVSHVFRRQLHTGEAPRRLVGVAARYLKDVYVHSHFISHLRLVPRLIGADEQEPTDAITGGRNGTLTLHTLGQC